MPLSSLTCLWLHTCFALAEARCRDQTPRDARSIETNPKYQYSRCYHTKGPWLLATKQAPVYLYSPSCRHDFRHTDYTKLRPDSRITQEPLSACKKKMRTESDIRSQNLTMLDSPTTGFQASDFGSMYVAIVQRLHSLVADEDTLKELESLVPAPTNSVFIDNDHATVAEQFFLRMCVLGATSVPSVVFSGQTPEPVIAALDAFTQALDNHPEDLEIPVLQWLLSSPRPILADLHPDLLPASLDLAPDEEPSSSSCPQHILAALYFLLSDFLFQPLRAIVSDVSTFCRDAATVAAAQPPTYVSFCATCVEESAIPAPHHPTSKQAITSQLDGAVAALRMCLDRAAAVASSLPPPAGTLGSSAPAATEPPAASPESGTGAAPPSAEATDGPASPRPTDRFARLVALAEESSLVACDVIRAAYVRNAAALGTRAILQSLASQASDPWLFRTFVTRLLGPTLCDVAVSTHRRCVLSGHGSGFQRWGHAYVLPSTPQPAGSPVAEHAAVDALATEMAHAAARAPGSYGSGRAAAAAGAPAPAHDARGRDVSRTRTASAVRDTAGGVAAAKADRIGSEAPSTPAARPRRCASSSVPRGPTDHRSAPIEVAVCARAARMEGGWAGTLPAHWRSSSATRAGSVGSGHSGRTTAMAALLERGSELLVSLQHAAQVAALETAVGDGLLFGLRGYVGTSTRAVWGEPQGGAEGRLARSLYATEYAFGDVEEIGHVASAYHDIQVALTAVVALLDKVVATQPIPAEPVESFATSGKLFPGQVVAGVGAFMHAQQRVLAAMPSMPSRESILAALPAGPLFGGESLRDVVGAHVDDRGRAVLGADFVRGLSTDAIAMLSRLGLGGDEDPGLDLAVGCVEAAVRRTVYSFRAPAAPVTPAKGSAGTSRVGTKRSLSPSIAASPSLHGSRRCV